MLGVVGGDHVADQGHGLVLDLYDRAVKDAQHGRNVQEVEDQQLVLAKDVATQDLVDEGVGNVAGDTSHVNVQGSLLSHLRFGTNLI